MQCKKEADSAMKQKCAIDLNLIQEVWVAIGDTFIHR